MNLYLRKDGEKHCSVCSSARRSHSQLAFGWVVYKVESMWLICYVIRTSCIQGLDIMIHSQRHLYEASYEVRPVLLVRTWFRRAISWGVDKVIHSLLCMSGRKTLFLVRMSYLLVRMSRDNIISNTIFSPHKSHFSHFVLSPLFSLILSWWVTSIVGSWSFSEVPTPFVSYGLDIYGVGAPCYLFNLR